MDVRDLKPLGDQRTPIYFQLYRRFRDAIAAGRLAPGDRVPSVRSLASELNLARGTVEAAYRLLTGEGYFLARGAAGTVVSPQLELHKRLTVPVESISQRRRPRAKASQPQPFQLGLPALDAFPRKTWVRLAARRLRAMNVAEMTKPEINGYEPLRRAIAAYLGISRGIACTPEQIFVTAGYRSTLGLICRSVLQPGDTGWFEDPGYPLARRFLEHAGVRLTPVRVDDEGLNVEVARQRVRDARFAVVTPTHQSPLGVPLSLPRRLALLEWAHARRAWIIEDDYDSEFRYQGRPLPALKSLDHSGRVLYAGTFSKVLYPGLRLAYLVVPEREIAKFRDAAARLEGIGSVLMQSAVADFMEQGHFARHLKKMRGLYATRRGYLIDALAEVFGETLEVPARTGGTHVLAYLKSTHSDIALAEAANAQGLAIMALSQWRVRGRSPAGLLLGFANLATTDQALELVWRLGKVCSPRGETWLDIPPTNFSRHP
jgi:GntR family transcriptional regulator / MocR family aminotransferase